ncbi:Hypothetical predicted protein, partial [Olea europaea subsp. europaea]
RHSCNVAPLRVDAQYCAASFCKVLELRRDVAPLRTKLRHYAAPLWFCQSQLHLWRFKLFSGVAITFL